MLTSSPSVRHRPAPRSRRDNLAHRAPSAACAAPRSWLLAALALGFAPAAAAQGTATASGASALSADPEMVFQRFGHRAIPGVHVPDADVRNTVRVGVGFQYQRNPVVAYRLDEELGPIVENRLVAQIGVSWDFMEWGTARVMAPAANANWGTAVAGFEAPGAGFGDVMVGLSFLPYRSKWFNLGLRGDMWLPTGRAQAYMGENSVRGMGGITAMGNLGPVDLVGDVAVVGRGVIDTNADFNLGPELVLSQALRLTLPWVPVAFTQTLIGRGGFTNFFQGGAENALELLGGLQVPLRDVGFNTDVTLDFMAGRGTNQGYGTTDLRVLAALTVARNPGRKPKPEIVVVEREPPPIPPPVEEPEEELTEETPVIIKDEQIVIRDPIEFYVDTADIKPESLPILAMVADRMNREAKIKHLVVEGHASEEGEYLYNYELSRSRAESVYKQLILDGVPPDRLSYRGFGEVKPKVAGSTEDALQQNRRVEFHIVAQFDEFAEFPDYGTSTRLPWTGEESRIVTPKTRDELKQEALDAKKAEDAKKAQDAFEGPKVDDDFSFDQEPESPTPERAVGEPDPLEDASFAPPKDDEFTMDGADAPKSPPVEPDADPSADGEGE